MEIYRDVNIALFPEPYGACSLCPPDVDLLPCCLSLYFFHTSGVYYSIETAFVNTPQPLSTLKILRDSDSPGTRTPNLGIKSALLCQLS
jgi:hypothetical protein